MSHSWERFTKFRTNATVYWGQAKAVTRLCTRTFGESYRFGWVVSRPSLKCTRKCALSASDSKSREKFDPSRLFVHFASASAIAALTECERQWSKARKEEQNAKQHFQTKLQEYVTSSSDLTNAEATVHKFMSQIEVEEGTLLTLSSSLRDAEDQVIEFEKRVLLAREKKEEKVKELQKAEEKRNLAKLKTRKKHKSKKKNAKLTEAFSEAERAVKLLKLEMENAEKTLAEAESIAKDQKNDVQQAQQRVEVSTKNIERMTNKMQIAESILKKAQDTQAKAMRVRDSAEIVFQQAETLTHERKLALDGLDRDKTFANWPGDQYAQEFPREFRDYEVNIGMETYELILGDDKIVDLYFEGLCGQVWSKEEKLKVAACVANAFGWTPIGGPCWQKVSVLKEKLLNDSISLATPIGRQDADY